MLKAAIFFIIVCWILQCEPFGYCTPVCQHSHGLVQHRGYITRHVQSSTNRPSCAR